MEVKADESQKSVQFGVTNNKPTAQTIDFSTADFNTLGESGGLVFIGTNPTEIQKKYGLSEWLKLEQDSVTIQPNKTATIRGVIMNNDSLSPGGHYGALMLYLNSGNSNSGNKIALKPIASSLLFVTKTGGDTHKLELASVDAKRNLFNLPEVVNLRFHNTGNTHLIPRGTITITKSDGSIIKRGIINENSNIILPETYRVYTIPLKNISSANIPGDYKLTVDYRFEGYDQFRRYQQSMFLLTPPFAIIAASVLIVVVGGSLYLLKNKKARKRFLARIKLTKKTK